MLAGTLAAAAAWLLAACGALPELASPRSASTPNPSSPSATAAASASVVPSSAPNRPPPSPAAPSPSSPPPLRARIAGLLVVGFQGTRLAAAPWVAEDLGRRGLGGVILFDRDQTSGGVRNVTSPSQVARLCAELQATAGHDIIIAVDQEGGLVTRLSPAYGFPAIASQSRIGQGTAAGARRWARTIAGTLAEAGINLNLAPVVDLDLNPDNPAIGALGRSFSADPDVVVQMASIECRAHRAARVRTTLKHFPGIGSATGNTDDGTVDVSATWTPLELEPFRRLSRDGPTSLSHAVVTGLLRDRLGWDGAVITDDLQAKAIAAGYGTEEAAVLALEAGNDLLLIANQQTYDAGIVGRVVDAIAAAVDDGRLTEGQVDRAWRRVQDLFRWST
jgi:beta-N-acetylhexosaminidase